MPKFSEKSIEKLNTCHENLIKLMHEVIKDLDVSIICGTRSDIEQKRLFDQGKSKLKAGESKHNNFPSLAVDVIPYFASKPYIDWSDNSIPDFAYMCGFIAKTAIDLGINIKMGCKWNKINIRDNKFRDYVHIELS